MSAPNEQQLAASHTLRGGVLISAGAGSGKTRTLVDRFVNALDDHDEDGWCAVGVDQVLAITFTEKAAAEIAERVRRALRESGRLEEARQCDGAWISTIHGFCSRILRRHAFKAEVDPNYHLLEGAAGELLQERAFEHACRADESGATLELLAMFGYQAVYGAVHALAGHHMTSAHELRLVPEASASVDALLADARGLLGTTRDEVRACGDAGKRAAQLVEECCGGLGLLEAIQDSDLGDAQRAFEIWEALNRFNPKAGARSINDTVAAAKEAKASLMARAATATLTPMCEALCALTVRYEGIYERLKQERGVLDFEDLQIKTAQLLRDDHDVLASVQDQLGLTMVDELQDTNELQLALVSAVAGENLCSVGDAQQSIYRFRGAQVDVYREHREHMRSLGAREFELAVNYRSHADILAFVNHVFRPLFGESFMALHPGREAPDALPASEPRVEATFVKVAWGTGAERSGRAVEAETIATRFAELRDEHGFDPSDMVILLRSYRHAQAYAEALAKRGFAASVVGGSRFFSAPEVAVARALLAAIVNPAHDEPLAVLLASQAVDVSPATLWRLGAYRKEHKATLWDAVKWAARTTEGHEGDELSAVVSAIEGARDTVGAITLPELIMQALERLEYDLTLAAQGAKGADALANVGKLLSLAKEFEASGESGPAAFLASLDARERYGEHQTPATDIAPESGVVQIMSIHSSKGLEFPVVALPELAAGGQSDRSIALWETAVDGIGVSMRLPSGLSNTKNASDTYSVGYARLKRADADADLAEKHRLFYVACTRAKEVLLLSGSGTFSGDPDLSSSAPIEWLRSTLAAGVEPDGSRHLQQIGEGAVCAVEMIDAGAWHDDRMNSAPPDVTSTKPVSEPGSNHPSVTVVRPSRAASGQQSALQRLSFTDFSAFEVCPKRFWVTRMLRVGSVPSTGADDPMVLGTAVHAALELSVADGPVGDERLAAVAQATGLSPSSVGELTAAVRSFEHSETARLLSAHEQLAAEWPFFIPVGAAEGGFTLVGSIDAYGRSGDSALIVDYKTGRSGDTAQLEERYGLQARIYAFAALTHGCTSVRVVFSRPQVTDETGRPEEVEFVFGETDRQAIGAELLERHSQIVHSEYGRRGSWDHHACGTCPAYGSICDIRRGSGRSAR